MSSSSVTVILYSIIWKHWATKHDIFEMHLYQEFVPVAGGIFSHCILVSNHGSSVCCTMLFWRAVVFHCCKGCAHIVAFLARMARARSKSKIKERGRRRFIWVVAQIACEPLYHVDCIAAAKMGNEKWYVTATAGTILDTVASKMRCNFVAELFYDNRSSYRGIGNCTSRSNISRPYYMRRASSVKAAVPH